MNAGVVQLDINTLKSLLAEQAATINETQRHAISEAMSDLKRDFERQGREVRAELVANKDRIQKVDDKDRQGGCSGGQGA